jgi:rhomboid protease GluP
MSGVTRKRTPIHTRDSVPEPVEQPKDRRLADVRRRLADHRQTAAEDRELQSEFDGRVLTRPASAGRSLAIVNVVIFVVMVGSGVSFWDPPTSQLRPWGAARSVEIQGGQWWRLLTSNYLHFGIWHLVVNVVALWYGTQYIERLFGSLRFLAIYTMSGIAGALACALVFPRVTSAGASGAIFGVYGALLAILLYRKRIVPKRESKRIGRVAIAFILASLLYAYPDWAAQVIHFGGFLMGLVVAVSLPDVQIMPNHRQHPLQWTLLWPVSILVCMAILLASRPLSA